MNEYLSLEHYLTHIKDVVCKSIQAAFPNVIIKSEDIDLQKPPKQDLGQFAYACFPLAKQLKTSPAAIASMVAENFVVEDYVVAMQATGPYINIAIDLGRFAATVCHTIVDKKSDFGKNCLGKGRKVMVEYSSPNTNKPLHIGHVRNNLIGVAIANILQFSGFEVVKANLINDRGIHICKSMLAYQKWGKQATPQSTSTKGDHLVGEYYVRFESALKEERQQYAHSRGIDLQKFAKDYQKQIKDQIRSCKDKQEKRKLQQQLRDLAEEEQRFEHKFLSESTYYQQAMALLRRWEQGDSEVRLLWKQMNNWVMEGFHQTYAALGCSFDKIYLESETYTLGRKYVEQGLAAGNFYQKDDNSIWVSAPKLKEANPQAFKGLPLKDKLLLRGDGTSVYVTQDIGTAILKAKDFAIDHSIYVVADEQSLHFKTLFAILKLLGFAWADNCRHVAYGMVTLPHGMGKIKSREGTAVDADDLLADMTTRATEKIRQAKTTGKIRVSEEKISQTARDIALAALKVFMLNVSLEKSMQFDPHKTIEFTGDTGPAIQYSHARICSILRKAVREYHIEIEKLAPAVDYALLTTAKEQALVRHLGDFPQIVMDTVSSYNISIVTAYLLALTKSFATFYDACRVLKAETPELRNARLVLVQATAQVIKNGMALLGATVPESM